MFGSFYLFYLFYLFFSFSNKSLPKGYSTKFIKNDNNDSNGSNGVERKNYIAPNRDRFFKKKIPQDLDAIIIGSGIGGLSCAAFLRLAI
jgi:hypothetical protein